MAETKQTRERAFIRKYDYATGSGSVCDAQTGVAVQEFNLSDLPQEVVSKLALAGLMNLVAGAGVDAHRDGEDAKEAMAAVVADLAADKVEFRDGVGIAMGGTLKRVARALVDLGYTKAKNPAGKVLTWEKGDIAGALDAMKTLWDTPENKEAKQESGRTLFNKIKATPQVAAKLAQYSRKPSGVELS